MIRYVLALALLCLLPTVAVAQTATQCPDRPDASNDNSCANTRWVKKNAGGGGGSVSPNQYLGNLGAGTTGITIPNCPAGLLNYTNGSGFACQAATGLPSIANGHLIANATGGTTTAGDTTATGWFDQAYCSTVGYIVVRFTGSWTCARGIPAQPEMFDSSCGSGTSHECTAAVQSCVATTNCYLSSGRIYAINNTIDLTPVGSVPVTLWGAGGAPKDAPGIINAGAGSSLLWMQPSGAGNIAVKITSAGTSVHDIAIQYETQGTGPGGNAPVTGGIGIQSTQPGANYLTYIYNISVVNAYIGIETAPGAGIGEIYQNIFIFNSAYIGFAVIEGGPYSIINVSTSGNAGSMSLASLYAYGTSSLVVTGGEWFHSSGYCVLALPDGSPGGNLIYSWITGAYFDTCDLGSKLDTVQNSQIISNWFAGGRTGVGYPGLTIQGSSTQNAITANTFASNGAAGLFCGGGTFLTFTANLFIGNGVTHVGGSPGIEIFNCQNFEITSNVSHGNAYGIYVYAGNNFYSIQNNLVNGNTTGITNLGTSFNVQSTNY